MPTEILMPALSPTMEDGTLSKWHVKEGDDVSIGDLIAEIETDKAVIDFEAIEEGTIQKLLVPEGGRAVQVNHPIAVLIGKDEESLELEPINDDSFGLELNDPSISKISKDEAVVSGAEKLKNLKKDNTRIFASPLARRIAFSKGIDIKLISGTGPRGRIIKLDIEEFIKSDKFKNISQEHSFKDSTSSKATKKGGNGLLEYFANREFKEIPLDNMRKTIAQRLTESKQNIPHYYLRREVLIDRLLRFRAQANEKQAALGAKISINDFIIKACAVALQRVPLANVIWANDRLLQFKASDICVAVAVEGGLLTPVLLDAEQKTLSNLSKEMRALTSLAKEKKLPPSNYQGGSLTISNLGMFGVDDFDAVINPPHSGILAVGAGKKKPVFDDEGQVGIATVMSLSLSLDHRAIDGALGAELLANIVECLENPALMLV